MSLSALLTFLLLPARGPAPWRHDS
jgi:hypothetical protein